MERVFGNYYPIMDARFDVIENLEKFAKLYMN